MDDQYERDFRRHRVEMLDASRNLPISVKPGAQLDEAITVMLVNDFSQVPVLSSEHNAQGLVSWKAIGKKSVLGHQPCEFAKDAMERVEVVDLQDSLFDVIPMIARQDCVLVRGDKNVITGIVTAFDISIQLQRFAEPFWRLEDLESCLRVLLVSHFDQSDLDDLSHSAGASSKKPESVDHLSFGHYIELLSKPERWQKIGLRLDRAKFVAELRRASEIRNRLMHFRDTKELPQADYDFLSSCSRMLGQIVRARRSALGGNQVASEKLPSG